MSNSADQKMSMSTAGLSQDFLVVAEIKGRRVNEAIERGMRGKQSAVFLCECGHLTCSRTMELALADYGRIRQSFDRFLVAPGHEIADVDRVIQRHQDYVVVAKRQGRPADLARATDPRAEGGSREG
jgi:hypothetical protein